jgi:hypothetical protein
LINNCLIIYGRGPKLSSQQDRLRSPIDFEEPAQNCEGRPAVMKAFKLIFALSLLTIFEGQALGQDLIVYPAKGQSQQQMEKDKFTCHSFAKQQSGFDPMQTPPPAPAAAYPPPPGSAAGGVVRGGAGGAALGAAVGGIAGGWSGAGKGAALPEYPDRTSPAAGGRPAGGAIPAEAEHL